MLIRILQKLIWGTQKVSIKFWDWYNNSLLSIYGFVSSTNRIYFNGKTIIKIGHNCNISLGTGIVINSGANICVNSCNISKLIIKDNATLVIGNNVGISASAITAASSVVIGNNVNIGSGTIILDTNFHSTKAEYRSDRHFDAQHITSKPIIIEDNVFIGALCIILKGVTIGKNSIIAAGSVVVKSIPPDEIWGGNPAKFIKRVSD